MSGMVGGRVAVLSSGDNSPKTRQSQRNWGLGALNIAHSLVLHAPSHMDRCGAGECTPHKSLIAAEAGKIGVSVLVPRTTNHVQDGGGALRGRGGDWEAVWSTRDGPRPGQHILQSDAGRQVKWLTAKRTRRCAMRITMHPKAAAFVARSPLAELGGCIASCLIPGGI